MSLKSVNEKVSPSQSADERDLRPHCPKCGSRDTRRSMRKGFLDGIMGLLSRRPARCRVCNRRFYLSAPVAIPIAVPSRG